VILSPQIQEFVTFEDRLDNSLQRDLVKAEHVRMRLTHEQINSELIDTELIELKFIFDRCTCMHGFASDIELRWRSTLVHHDNRDLETIPNYQPACQASLAEQTFLFKKDAAV
jgi:N-terminal acetyltransferase B complex non-catalytic subunit